MLAYQLVALLVDLLLLFSVELQLVLLLQSLHLLLQILRFHVFALIG